MKQITVISGKGGAGKTILTASFAAMAKDKVMVDCDVDAADLHLLLHPEIKETYEFKGEKKAVIDEELCNGCRECIEVCRFDAIEESSHIYINPLSCEGCQVCYYTCPLDAIEMVDNIAGNWYVSETKYGAMVHAQLGAAEENSGKLVTIVRQKAKQVAEERSMSLTLIDGPPGIGCPVISAITGVDAVLVVTEPTVSGIHDMERVIGVSRHFGIKTFCCINRYDINLKNTKKIEKWCEKNGVLVLGRIPFDMRVNQALIKGLPVVEYTDDGASLEIERIWKRLVQNL